MQELYQNKLLITDHIWALSVGKVTKKGVTGGAQWGSVVQNMPIGPPYLEREKNCCHITFSACYSNFCEANSQEFRLK